MKHNAHVELCDEVLSQAIASDHFPKLISDPSAKLVGDPSPKLPVTSQLTVQHHSTAAMEAILTNRASSLNTDRPPRGEELQRETSEKLLVSTLHSQTSYARLLTY